MAKITLIGKIVSQIAEETIGTNNTKFKKFAITVETGDANVSKKSVFGVKVFGKNSEIGFRVGDLVQLEGTIIIEPFQITPGKPAANTLVTTVSKIDVVTGLKQCAKARNMLGNLSKDAQLIPASSTPLTKTSLAVNDKVSGQKVTSYYDLLFWQERGTNLMQYLKKGTKVLVDGNIRTEYYDKTDGSGKGLNVSVSVDDFQFAGSRDDSEQGQGNNSVQQTNIVPEIDIDKDEIPF